MNTVFLRCMVILTIVGSFSCSKKSSDNCPETKVVVIEQNGPVTEGWPLVLKAQSTQSYLHKWSGPNGWKMEYNTFSSEAYLQTRHNMTAADAGEYTLQLVNASGCVEYEGSVTVEVKPAQAAPCNIPVNTSTSSVAGIGAYTFNHHTFGGSPNIYTISAGETVPGDYIRFAFLGDEPPVGGVYKTSGYAALEAGKVGLYIHSGNYDFIADLYQPVYVTKENNKLVISFCSLTFSNPITPSKPITISAKIKQP